MKLIAWILLGFAVAGLGFWIVTNDSIPKNIGIDLLIIFIFVLGPAGAFWMIHVAIRHEKHPLPMILLAFIPYTFLWYYFERYRGR